VTCSIAVAAAALRATDEDSSSAACVAASPHANLQPIHEDQHDPRLTGHSPTQDDDSSSARSPQHTLTPVAAAAQEQEGIDIMVATNKSLRDCTKTSSSTSEASRAGASCASDAQRRSTRSAVQAPIMAEATNIITDCFVDVSNALRGSTSDTEQLHHNIVLASKLVRHTRAPYVYWSSAHRS
jgi:hypothetical protein